MLINAEFRQHPLCPKKSPYVECPLAAGKTGHYPGWITMQHCMTCPNRARIEVGQGDCAPVVVDCLAAGEADK